ncbi:MAG: hypothetical protein H6698_09605 [Myxococcales bacterium]|nr:hypothetical protein [Myxococcales bacterium]MCB9532635.1 hypothetical protein [Myxococcales bacterium]MCB9534537.1 hypothetical protein [Myxococcales bacterium]
MTAPTAVVTQRDGTVVATPTATPDTTASTVDGTAAATDRIPVSDASGFVAGRWYACTDDAFGTALFELSAVEGSTLRLVDPLPSIPSDGAAVFGVEVVVTVAAIDELGEGFLLEVVDDGDGGTGQQVTQDFDVSRYTFTEPVQPEHVCTYISRTWPSEVDMISDGRLHRRIAQQSNDALAARLAPAERRLERYWSPSVLAEPGRILMQIILADVHRLIPMHESDRNEYVRGLRFELKDRISDLLVAPAKYDQDGDGTIDEDEKDGFNAVIGRGL